MAYMKNLKLFILTILVTAAVNGYAEIINRVYAVVGEKIITQYELETLNPKRLQMIYERFEGEELQEALDKYYLSALELLIDNYVIEQAAAREGVRVSEREVTMAVEDIMERNSVNEEKLQEMLAASNLTLEQYKWNIKIDILKARLMSTVFKPKIIITEDDIEKYAEENAETLELSDMYELRILTVGSKAKLDEAMADYEDSGSFRDTVMKFSESGNAEDGGYLGWVEVSFLDDEIRNVISGVKEGITEPISDDGSYRVFYVEGYKNKSELPEEKKKKIVDMMTEIQSKKIFENWIAQKKKEILIQKKYAN
ncbi:MAG: hypothetical protein C0602_10655 [Denitrovibrio sp.]|nr:MAG: hypothetical protein C0602_10655 [Denitrovibrio sp.]